MTQGPVVNFNDLLLVIGEQAVELRLLRERVAVLERMLANNGAEEAQDKAAARAPSG